MLPKKYHAIVFISVLVMLLLLGLHLLGIGYSSGQTTAKTAALARNSTQTSSSSNVNTALNPNQVYRHPIVYDKLTGATNNQINDVLGAKQPATSDYPIDHYQQQQQQQQQLQLQQPFNPLTQDDFLFNLHRQQQQQAPGFPPPGHPLNRHMLPHHLNGMQPPMPLQAAMMTTQTPNIQQQLSIPMQPQPPPPPAPPESNHNIQRQSLANDDLRQQQPQVDSIPSASSLNNNTSTSQQPSLANRLQQQQQPQASVYYTPPIFAYNNFDQNRPLNELQLGNVVSPYSYATQPLAQQQNQRRGPPLLGVPEAPLTIDEYNARQARIRQQQQQPIASSGEQNQDNRYTINHLTPQRLGNSLVEPQFIQTTQQPNNNNNNQNQNLLADPQQQQLHRQQMLDKQLLFGSGPFMPPQEMNNNINLTNNYYPDPALYRTPQVSTPVRAPPYAQQQQQPVIELNNKQIAQNRILPPNHRIESQQQSHLPLKQQQQQQQLIKSNNPNPLNHVSASQQTQALQHQQQETPACARQQQQLEFTNLELANSTNQMPILFCQDDSDYPTKDIMRALEAYAVDRSVEQLFPQPLIHIHLSTQSAGKLSNGQQQQQQQLALNGIQQQLTLDTLQPSINILRQKSADSQQPSGQLVSFDDQRSSTGSQQLNNLFPSTNYESLCKSNIFMAQPRRAKNIIGQWKIVVNLPGHKYRGIAISQMVRIEECSRPNSDCSAIQAVNRSLAPLQQLAKSRCLQQYENQRLVAWSHQQGLHLDIFRVPISCSCWRQPKYLPK